MHRLLFIAPSAYRLGGVQTWLDYIMPGLAKAGFDVHLGLVAGDFHDTEAYLEMHPFGQVHRIVPRQFTPRSRQQAIADLINSIQPDAVVGVNIADVYLAKRFFDARAAANCRVVVTNHALQPDFYADFRKFAPGIDAVVCTNRLSTALCDPLSGFTQDRVFYSPYGVPEARLRRVSTDAARFTLGYVGRLATEQKEILEVAHICAAARDAGLDFDLVIAGTGPQEDELKAALAASGLAERTQMLGHVRAEQLPQKFYARVDAMLITSSWETGPIVAWEAMAHDVAVVTSDYVGLKAENSLVDGENCRIFAQLDHAAAVAALRDVADAQYRQRLVAGGHRLIGDRYTVAASVRQWAETLEQACTLPVKPQSDMPEEELRQSRLEAVLGENLSANIREMLGRKPKPRAAGDEWPHGYSRITDRDAFWKAAREADRRPVEVAA